MVQERSTLGHVLGTEENNKHGGAQLHAGAGGESVGTFGGPQQTRQTIDSIAGRIYGMPYEAEGSQMSRRRSPPNHLVAVDGRV